MDTKLPHRSVQGIIIDKLGTHILDIGHTHVKLLYSVSMREGSVLLTFASNVQVINFTERRLVRQCDNRPGVCLGPGLTIS